MDKELEIIELGTIGYDLIDNVELGDEEDVCNNLKDCTGYVCDGLSELADSSTPIYYSDVWKNAQDVQEYVEEAVNEGLVDTNNFDIDKTLQVGYYFYYEKLLNANLENIAHNVLVDYVNELKLESCEELGDIEEQIEILASDFDYNSSWGDLKEELQAWIDEQMS